MGMNAIEKILANHSDQHEVNPGDVVVVDVDVTVQFDSARPDVLRIANPEKLVLLHDHVVPAPTVQAANNAKRLREFVARFDIPNYFPVGQHGISHVLVAQEGYALPGQILVNAGDVHANFSLRADGLTAVMLVMVTFIGSLIAIYSAGYMANERLVGL